VLGVQVIEHSDGSYLEDQDYWRISGIFRDVFLLAQPVVRLRDFRVQTDLDESYRHARLSLRGALENRSLSPAADGAEIYSTLLAGTGAIAAGQEAALDASGEVSAPRLWTAETVGKESTDSSDCSLST
jgi:beta-galactosidase